MMTASPLFNMLETGLDDEDNDGRPDLLLTAWIRHSRAMTEYLPTYLLEGASHDHS